MESDLDPNTSQERPDLSTVRIVSTNYAALLDNRKKHSYANVILQILYRLTAFRCYLLDLVGQTVPFSKVTQWLNGLLQILRSMYTQAITMSSWWCKRLGRLDMEWQWRNQSHRQRHSGDQPRTCPGRIRRSSDRARCRTSSGGLSLPSGRRCSTVRWRRRPLPERDKLLCKLPNHVLEAADLGERTELWSDEEDWAELVRVVDSLSEHRSDAARRIMARAMCSCASICAPPSRWAASLYVVCGEEDYWIIVILCVRERREDRFYRAGMVAWLEKFIKGLKMCWRAMSRQVKMHMIIISCALVANWKRDYPAAKTLLALQVQRRGGSDKPYWWRSLFEDRAECEDMTPPKRATALIAGAVRNSRDIGEALCIGDTEFIRRDPTVVWLLCQVLLISLTMKLHSVS